MRIVERVKDTCRLFGMRGVIAAVTHHAIRFPRYIRVKYHGNDVYMRFGTSDQCVYEEVLFDKCYEFDPGLTPKIIVDAGANIGCSSIYFANRYPSAAIIAIEPEVTNFVMLERNVRPYRQIAAIHAALWRHEELIHISSPLGGGGPWEKWSTTTSENGDGELIQAVSVRALMDRFRLSSIDLLKVDIEGSEVEVFSSCDWMHLVNALVIETHDRFRLGCSAAVDAATSEFQKTHAGRAGNLAFYTKSRKCK